jgi:hypothetical protein
MNARIKTARCMKNCRRDKKCNMKLFVCLFEPFAGKTGFLTEKRDAFNIHP